MKQIFFIKLFLLLTPVSFLNGRNFHSERLQVLKRNGFNPRIVYDIGAHQGSWTNEVRAIFNSAHYYLFEANNCHESALKSLRFPYFITLLGDCQKMVPFYSINGTGDSIFIEQTHHYKEGHYTQKLIPMTTLDTLVQEHALPYPDFVKMDVQGAEKLVILGGKNTLVHAEAILLEIAILEYNKNAPLIFEIMSLMDQLDYCMLDVFELHYLPTQELMEVDVLFVKKDSRLIKRGILC